MLDQDTAPLSAKEVVAAERQMLRDVCVALGTAMRHSFLNHKEKSEKAWEKFADKLYEMIKEDQ